MDWINKYFYRPRYFEAVVSLCMLPFSLIYALCATSIFKMRRKMRPKQFGCHIISVGNLTVGGSGKTPLVKAIFNVYRKKRKTFIVLRGYKRHSKGVLIVANHGVLLSDYHSSGDEAMEYATTLSDANVIVSESKVSGIKTAVNLGAELVILDDGFSRPDIEKFSILLPPPMPPIFNLTLPSGAWRYPKSYFKYADFIPSPSDIKSEQSITNETPKMVLVTAIANPARLKDAFDKCAGFKIFSDHHEFSQREIDDIFAKFSPTSLLVTRKDFVKLEHFNIPLSIIELKTSISPAFLAALDGYLAQPMAPANC